LDPNGGLTFNSTSLLVEKAQPDTSFDPKGVVRRREMEVIFESNMCDGFDGLVFLDVYLILKSGMRAVATRAKDIFDAAYGRHHVEDEAILEANRACDTEKNKVLDRLVRNAQSGQLLAGMLLSLEQAVGEQLPFKKVYEQGFQLPDFRKNPRHVINYIPSGLQ
jgi:hypothetical protein